MKKQSGFLITAMIFIAAVFVACEKEEAKPTVAFTASVNGYAVTFTSEVTNATAYLWDFGDDATSTEANPSHTYDQSGTYTVTLTVNGDGGQAEATEEVDVLASLEELLTGGPAATNGKTWVLSHAYVAGVDGGGVINNDMWVMLPSKINALDSINMGQEYDNEFTFYHDGTYVVDIKNDTALTATLFGLFGGEVEMYSNANNDLGLNLSSFTAPESATWTLHDEALVVDVITEPLGTAVPAPHAEVTITGKNWISLSEGAYFGILDFPTTRKFVIKEITPEKMTVALFVCAYWADVAGSGSIPTFFYHMTFVPKQ
jgi:PKD repeat protein